MIKKMIGFGRVDEVIGFEHLYFELLCLFRISCFEFRI